MSGAAAPAVAGRTSAASDNATATERARIPRRRVRKASARRSRYETFTALGDPTRRAIFESLAEQPRAVGELARDLPVSRPAVSQHLKVLKGAGLVVDRKAGKRRIYRVDPAGLAQLRAELDGFWTKTLAAYKAAVEQPEKGDQ